MRGLLFWVLLVAVAMLGVPNQTTAQWFYLYVDSAGSYPSLEVDRNNLAHISYYAHNPFRRNLRYVYYDGTSWVYDTVDVAGNVGKWSSLELDTLGYPHIAYYDDTNEDLKYAHWDGSDWNIQVVDTGDVVDNDCWLALNPTNNHGHISYQRENHLMHAWWDGTNWQREVVDPSPWTGYYCSIGLDPADNNHPCISYVDALSDWLTYAYWDGLTWNFETVDNSSWFTSLDISPGGVPHIAYWKTVTSFFSELRHAWRIGPNNWAREPVPWPSQAYGLYPSLRLDVWDNPWVSFYDAENENLLLAHKEDGVWEVDTVAHVGDEGTYVSLALKQGAQPCISFYDRTDEWLKYAEMVWLDVGVDSILAPPDTTPPGPLTVMARIRNFGSLAVQEQFDVSCDIDGWSDTCLVSPPFYPGSTYVCTFSQWIPPGPGIHTMCVTTQLADSNPANNQLCKTILIEHHDVGVISILSPPDTVYCHYWYPPSAEVQNFGNITESVEVYCTINSLIGYSDADTVVIGVNQIDTVEFDELWWVPPLPGGPYDMTVWAFVPGDSNAMNDSLHKQIHIICLAHDGAVDSILTPPDSVDFGSTYPVGALVHNYAEVTEDSFWVVCEITPGYVDSFWVDSLMSDDTLTASFDSFTVSALGPYQMCVFTLVAGDECPANDTLCKDIFVRYRDGAVTDILSPPPLVIAGLPYPVVLQVSNWGSVHEDSFQVKCTIDLDGYQDSTWVCNLAPGASTPCTLQDWTPIITGLWTLCAWTEVLGDTYPSNDTLCMDGQTGVEELLKAEIPKVFGLSQSRPNPTSSVTTIRYQVPKQTQVSLKLYDMTGKLVRVLVDSAQRPGFYQVIWNGKDGRGNEVPSGIYFYRLTAHDFLKTRKMVLIR